MAKSDIFYELAIQLPTRNYSIVIGRNILSASSDLLRHSICAKQVLIVTNKTIASWYLGYLQATFAKMECDVVLLDDGEEFKSQQSLALIYETLINKRHHRDTTIIALGGGVVGDISGFAASTYQRGVRLVQIPTSLLAQVDAAVGGKTAINHWQAKNMIGSFYQPNAVFIDLNTLSTLPLREFRAGLAEVIKYSLLVGGEFFELVNRALTIGFTSHSLAQIIFQSCQIKAKFVQEDEYETGVRALLNLGHTFAHALEAYSHYQRWLHGEAVAIGLYCAALLSHRLGHLDHKSLLQVDEMLTKAQLPSRIPPDINLDELQIYLLHDKKIANKHLRLILMKAIGECYIDNKVSNDCLRSMLESVVNGDNNG